MTKNSKLFEMLAKNKSAPDKQTAFIINKPQLAKEAKDALISPRELKRDDEPASKISELRAAFVTGKIDELPAEASASSKPNTISAQPLQAAKPKSLKELFAKSKASAQAKPDANKSGRDILHGTGITKKIAEQSEKVIVKTETLSLAEQMKKISEYRQQMAEAAAKKAEETKDLPTFVKSPLTAATEEMIAAEEALAVARAKARQVLADEQHPSFVNETAAKIVEKKHVDIVLDDSQAAALEGMKNEQFACLIGAAGTGKTTVTKRFIEEIEKELTPIDISRALGKEGSRIVEHPICFCAFTGRATQMLRRVLPRKYHKVTHTIHKTLGFYPEDCLVPDKDNPGYEKVVKRFVPWFTAQNKLPYKVAIIDETGMLGIDLWNQFLAALQPDCRIYFIGDINQLPPVMGKSVLGFGMINWPTFGLEKIHRQAEGNPIIANAHRILKGKLPLQDKKHFTIVNAPDSGIKAYEFAINVIKQLHGKFNVFDPINDAFIVPQNKGTVGQIHFNEKLVMYFNPTKKDENGAIMNARNIIIAGRTHAQYAIGDKVMTHKNDAEKGLTNGMTGVVIDISPNPGFVPEKSQLHMAVAFNEEIDMTDIIKDDKPAVGGETTGIDDGSSEEKESEAQRQASHIMVVRFPVIKETEDEKGYRDVLFQTAGQFGVLSLAYAITCHKAQGGEFNTVVILCHSSNARMLSREWLYTAVTRAKDRVVLICNDRGLQQAVGRQNITGNTLKEKAQVFLALQDRTDTRVPDMPAPVRIA